MEPAKSLSEGLERLADDISDGIGSLFKGACLVAGGIISFAISAFIALGIIGVLYFGVKQLF
ncbi:MAG: hypothetical protein AB7G06_00220 [Bdellovibrionales bacterium]